MTTRKSWPARLLELSSALVVLLFATGPVRSDELARAVDPTALGFSAARLARIAPWYQARFDAFPPSDETLVPGAVIAIAKDGKLAYLQAIGFQDRAKTIPMKPDSIFWIASMSKPVTSVAAMILVDEGKLDLDAPVARYVPEIVKMQVLAEKADPATGKIDYRLDPQKHPMTVRDLLRHTSGIAYPELDFGFPERGLADAATAEADRIPQSPCALCLDRRDLAMAPRRDAGKLRLRLARAPAAGASARRSPRIWLERRRARPGYRSGFRGAARSIPAAPHLCAAAHGRHRLLRPEGKAPAASSIHRCQEPRPRVWEVTSTGKPVLLGGGRVLVSTAAIISGLPRCCSTVASWTASACSARRR